MAAPDFLGACAPSVRVRAQYSAQLQAAHQLDDAADDVFLISPYLWLSLGQAICVSESLNVPHFKVGAIVYKFVSHLLKGLDAQRNNQADRIFLHILRDF